MSEFDRVDYCPKCGKDKAFNFSGSGRIGICPDCGFILERNPISEGGEIFFNQDLRPGKRFISEDDRDFEKKYWTKFFEGLTKPLFFDNIRKS